MLLMELGLETCIRHKLLATSGEIVITICISGTVQSKVSIFQILVVFVLVWSNGHLASLQHVSSISCPHLMFQRLWLSPEAIFARMEYRRCPEGVLSYIMLQSSFTSEFSRLL
ncbi:hypothetical protein V6Z12_A12G169500 [Gossypium hirsutum]